MVWGICWMLLYSGVGLRRTFFNGWALSPNYRNAHCGGLKGAPVDGLSVEGI